MPDTVSWFLFFSKEDRVLALPSWTAPRILIVSRSAGQRWKDSATFYPALRVRAKIVKLGIRILAAYLPGLFARHASSSGAGERNHRVAAFLYSRFPSFKQSAIAYSLFPSFFVEKGVIDANAFGDCPDERGGLTDVISRYFSECDRVVLISGAASDPKQKLVARVLDRSGNDLGYLKFGEKPLARQRIENEARILEALPDGAGPAFGGFEQTDKFSCFAMSAVDGKLMEARLPEASENNGRMSEVKGYLDRLKKPEELFEVDVHPAIVRMRQQTAKIRDQRSDAHAEHGLLSSDLLDGLLIPLRQRRWPSVIQHGDLTPWNILRCPSSDRGSQTAGIRAIDWEEGTLEGFPCFDLIYFIIQTAFFMHHWEAEKAFAYALGRLSGSNYDETEARSLIKLAALDAWLNGETGGLSGNALQQFRLSIVNYVENGNCP